MPAYVLKGVLDEKEELLSAPLLKPFITGILVIDDSGIMIVKLGEGALHITCLDISFIFRL